MLSAVPVDISPQKVTFEQGTLRVIWPDNHQSLFPIDSIHSSSGISFAYQSVPWPKAFSPLDVDVHQLLKNSVTVSMAIFCKKSLSSSEIAP